MESPRKPIPVLRHRTLHSATLLIDVWYDFESADEELSVKVFRLRTARSVKSKKLAEAEHYPYRGSSSCMCSESFD
jgi:hypothetical protein